jgi:hypothetical protein
MVTIFESNGSQQVQKERWDRSQRREAEEKLEGELKASE